MEIVRHCSGAFQCHGIAPCMPTPRLASCLFLSTPTVTKSISEVDAITHLAPCRSPFLVHRTSLFELPACGISAARRIGLPRTVIHSFVKPFLAQLVRSAGYSPRSCRCWTPFSEKGEAQWTSTSVELLASRLGPFHHLVELTAGTDSKSTVDEQAL